MYAKERVTKRICGENESKKVTSSFLDIIS